MEQSLLLTDGLGKATWSIPRGRASTTIAATLDQAEEDILTTTVSDETLEAAVGTDKGGYL